MGRIIDVAKVQEALDRAARNALHGTRDVRAGRFVAVDAVAHLPSKPRRIKPRDAQGGSTEARTGKVLVGRSKANGLYVSTSRKPSVATAREKK